MNLRRIGIGCLGLIVAFVVLIAVSLVAVSSVASSRFARVYDVPIQQTAVPNDAAALERGEHFARAISDCFGCHGEDLGGQVMMDGGPALGVLAAPNITPAGKVADYTDEDWFAALRHGLAPDRTPLFIMPSHELAAHSVEDIAALIAFLKSAPPVEREVAPTDPGPVMLGVWLSGAVPNLVPAESIDHTAPPPKHMAPEPTAAYGERLAVSCRGCHGTGLSGGAMPGAPPDMPAPTNITPHESGLKAWSEADFVEAIRTGKRPDGSDINPFMPWKSYRHMTDVELSALYAYLREVPPLESGNR